MCYYNLAHYTKANFVTKIIHTGVSDNNYVNNASGTSSSNPTYTGPSLKHNIQTGLVYILYPKINHLCQAVFEQFRF